MDTKAAVSYGVKGGGPVVSSVFRLMQTVLDGTVESFFNIFDNVSERLIKRQESFPEPLHGMVAIVTGGNAGIGFATAQQLARRGAHVVLACRDKDRAEAAVQAITRTPLLPGCGSSPPSASASPYSCALPAASATAAAAAPGVSVSPRVEAMELDLGRLASVRRFAEEWRRRGLPLHLLVCNAGVMGPPQRLETADGLEVQFQVNFLSHWLLANHLMAIERDRRIGAATAPSASKAAIAGCAMPPPASSTGALPDDNRALRDATEDDSKKTDRRRRWVARTQVGAAAGVAAAAATPVPFNDGSTRVVMVTSLTHRAGPLQWHDKQSRERYDPFVSYGLSKLANILAAKELQRRFDRSPSVYGRDTAVAVHPGLVSTSLANNFFADSSTGWAATTPLKPLVEAAVGAFGQVVGPLLMRSPDQSAAFMLHACLTPSSQVAGSYLALGRIAQPDGAADDLSMAMELWSYAQQLTGYTPHSSLCGVNSTCLTS